MAERIRIVLEWIEKGAEVARGVIDKLRRMAQQMAIHVPGLPAAAREYYALSAQLAKTNEQYSNLWATYLRVVEQERAIREQLVAARQQREKVSASIARQAPLLGVHAIALGTAIRRERELETQLSETIRTRYELGKSLSFTQERLEYLTEAEEKARKEVRRVERRFVGQIRAIRRAAWGFGILGWVIAYHVRRAAMMFTRFFRTFVRVFRRIFRFIWELIRLLARWERSVESLIGAMIALSMVGLITAEREEVLRDMIQELIRIGPAFAAILGLITAAQLRLALSLGAALMPYIDRLIGFLYEIIAEFEKWQRPISAIMVLLEDLAPIVHEIVMALLAMIRVRMEEWADIIIAGLGEILSVIRDLLSRLPPIITEVLERFREFLIHIGEEAPRLLERLPRVIDAILDALEAILPVLPQLAQLATMQLRWMALIIGLSPQLVSLLISMGMAFNLLGPIIASCSYMLQIFTKTLGLSAGVAGAYIIAIMAIIMILILLIQNWDKVTAALRKFWQSLRQTIDWCIDKINELHEVILASFGGIYFIIRWLIERLCLADAFKRMFDEIRTEMYSFGREFRAFTRELPMFAPGRAVGRAGQQVNVNISIEHLALADAIDLDEFLRETTRRIAWELR